MEATHDLEVQTGFADDGCTAFCSCGWEADAPSTKAAIAAWDNHCDVTFMESTMEAGA